MPQLVDKSIRELRITIGGLIAGVVCFAALAYALKGSVALFEGLPRAEALLAGLALVSVGSAVGYLAQYRKMVGEVRGRAAEMRQASEPLEVVVAAYRPFAIIGGGLIEGPSVAALVVYMATRSPIALATAGVGIALLVLHMPSRERLEALAGRGTRL